MKICYKCKIEKDESKFGKNKSKKDGLHYLCKECTDKYNQLKKIKDKIIVERKFCKKCIIEKDESEFNKDKSNKDGLCNRCKECEKEYHIKNKEKIQKRKSKNYQDNKEIAQQKSRDNYHRHKNKRIEYSKKYRKENIKRIREWEIKNKERRLEQSRKYNRKDYNNNWTKQKRQQNPSYKLRCNISTSIYQYLKKKKSGKFGESISQYLPYSPEDLKQHLESQFESWMTWENWGKISITERTWNIDHIIPQSSLPYTSMKEENFQKCWALENLRPLEAMENIKKSNKILGKNENM